MKQFLWRLRGLAARGTMAVLLVVVMAGCSSVRKGVKGREQSALESWSELRVPVQLRVESPKSFSYGSISLTMKRGRSVLFSMHFLGMEVGAIYLTPDSLMAYSRPQRICVAEDLSTVLGGVKLPLEDIQKLLIGQSLPAYADDLKALRAMGFSVETRLTAQGKRPEHMTVSQSSTGRALRLDWTRGNQPESLPFATALGINLTKSGGKPSAPLSATITYSWDQATFDTPSTRQFRLPSGYRQVEGRALLELLTSL